MRQENRRLTTFYTKIVLASPPRVDGKEDQQIYVQGSLMSM